MASNALNLPLLVKPELASNPEVAAKIAIWYWNTRVKPHVNNFNDTAAVTKKINSSMHGLESREANFMAYLEKKVIGKPA
jgi:putative chitinase